jgi:hypothetical protein
MKSTTTQINSVASAAKSVLTEQSEIPQPVLDAAEKVSAFTSEMGNTKNLSKDLETLRVTIRDIDSSDNLKNLEDQLALAEKQLDEIITTVEPLTKSLKFLMKEIDSTFKKINENK